MAEPFTIKRKGGKELKRLVGGIDIGSEYHHIIIMSEEEKILYDRKIKCRGSEFYKAMEEFKGLEKSEKGKI